MSSNKSVRKRLEQLYGKECFIEKLHLRKSNQNTKYTSKGQRKKMKQLTYHHILERSKGGKATVENGALLSNENHIWLHQQSKEKRDKINQIFQDYKHLVDECKVVLVDDLEIPYKVIPTTFEIEDKKKEHYDRAKKKHEDRKLIKEYEREER